MFKRSVLIAVALLVGCAAPKAQTPTNNSSTRQSGSGHEASQPASGAELALKPFDEQASRPEDERRPGPPFSGDWHLSGNADAIAGSSFLGTTNETAVEIRVKKQRALLLKPDPLGFGTSPDLIGGSYVNTVTDGVCGATIGGGGFRSPLVIDPPKPNCVTDNFGTVSGGAGNQAGDNKGTSSDASHATVGGGYRNTASGAYSSVPGGEYNEAAGAYSFAAGFGAKAYHAGCFVWADSSHSSGEWPISSIFASQRENQFLIQASGGVGIGTTSTPSPLTVAGTVESTGIGGGFKFPDGSIQASAAPAVCWSLGGNSGTDAKKHFIGTSDEVPLEIKVNGSRALKIELKVASPNMIGGYEGNTALDEAWSGATICGGGMCGKINTVTGQYGTVCGGYGNAAGFCAVVCGGEDNTASNGEVSIGGGSGNNASGRCSTIAGGQGNVAEYLCATVGGGEGNTASGTHASVCGGQGNTAHGNMATICGGYKNTTNSPSAIVCGGSENFAGGRCSFAAGYHSHVREAKEVGPDSESGDEGTFVWADKSTDSDFTSTGSNQFMVRASGGVYIYTNPGLTSGVRLATGAYEWSRVSDRAAKENFDCVQGRELLDRLATVPIETWNYKSQDCSIRHIGPMAQDFHAAFGVGEDEKTISTIDADGVALAAIQGLDEVVQEKDAEMKSALAQKDAQIADIAQRLDSVEAENAGLRARLAKIEAALSEQAAMRTEARDE